MRLRLIVLVALIGLPDRTRAQYAPVMIAQVIYSVLLIRTHLQQVILNIDFIWHRERRNRLCPGSWWATGYIPAICAIPLTVSVSRRPILKQVIRLVCIVLIFVKNDQYLAHVFSRGDELFYPFVDFFQAVLNVLTSRSVNLPVNSASQLMCIGRHTHPNNPAKEIQSQSVKPSEA